MLNSMSAVRIMFKRHKLEKEEGKSYNDPGVRTIRNVARGVSLILHPIKVSTEMKALNSLFSQLHGVSSLLNLSAVIAAIFHGSWIANKGIGNL